MAGWDFDIYTLMIERNDIIQSVAIAIAVLFVLILLFPFPPIDPKGKK